MEEKIGKLESVWRTVEQNGKDVRKYETTIDYLLTYGEFGESGDECYGATRQESTSKVLLAQMDAGTAALLAAHHSNRYHFDVVISQYDQQRFTRNQITLVDPTLSSTGNSQKEEPPKDTQGQLDL